MQHRHTSYFDKRDSGVSLIGDLSWGSHFCQFYQTSEDLLEILVPYLRVGLASNEFCVWVVDGSPGIEDAQEALKKAVPRLAEHARKGQIEIVSRDQWCTGGGEPGLALVSRLNEAVSRGFDGLRFACNAWPEDARERNGAADAICGYNAIALFAYPRDQFDAIGLMAVVKNHRLALVKNAGRWEVIESSEAQTAKDALRRSGEKLHSVFANMSEGYGYHRIVLDAGGVPCDYVFLEINEAFERLTGLQAQNIIGRKATEVLPGIEKDPVDWIGTYGKVALTEKPVQFENYSQLLRKWYSVSAFCPHKGFFAVTFGDITARKAAEEAIRSANERLQSQAEELQTQAEELQAQTDERNSQAEELKAANERLHRSEQALRISEQRVRTKLDSILSPDGDLGTLELADIIDSQAIQSLVEDFHRLARIPLSIIDFKGRVLVGVGWQDICTRFHRVHPETCRHCVESDTELSAGIAPGQCRLYKCKNNMWDIATPLLVGGKHVGNLFSGQFFFEDEPVDRGLFRSQARRYGFDEQEYLASLDAVPRLSRESVDTGMAFFMKLARMLSQLSYSNIQLARSLEERRVLMESQRRSRKRFELLSETAGRLLTEENPQRIVNALCHKVMEHLDCHAFFNFLVDEKAGRLRLNAWEGILEEEARRIEWLDYGVAVCGCVARDGVRIVAEDIASHPDPRTDLVASYGIRAYVCHPLMVAGKVLGTLSFGTRTRTHFSEDDLSLMKTVADQVAVAIQRILAKEAVWRVALFPEQNPLPVLRIARDGTLVYANGPSVGLLESWACETGRVVPDNIRRHVERALNAGEVLEVEIARGSTVYSFAIAPIVSEGYANLYGRDITERVRAEAERQRHLDLQVKLVQVTREILDAADLPSVLQKVADASLALTNARLGASGHGFINGRLQVQAVSCGTDAPSCRMAGGFSIDKGGVHLDLLREKESIRLMDEEMHAHPAWWGLPQGHMPLRGLLGARLIDAAGRPNGMIMVSDKADGDFTDEDEVVLRQLASITSLAIRLIEARDEAQQRACEAITAGAALRDSAERLRLALEGGRMGRWEWDLQSDSSFWDPRMYDLLGLDASKPPASKLLLTLVDSQDRNALQGLLLHVAARGGDFHTEFRVIRPDGERVWLTLCGKVILDDSGRGSRMFGVLYDITLRKQMEDQLRRLNDELEEEVQAQTEELRDTIDRLQDQVARRVDAEGKLRKHSQMLEGFFQHTITPLAFMDRDFNFIRVNEAYAASVGKTPEFFSGRNHFELYPHEENRMIFEQVVQTKQAYRAYAKAFAYSDASHRGTTYWNWQLTPLFDEKGEVQFLVLNLEDVTERQRAFQELERRARQLQHLTLELSQAEDRERRRLAEILHDDLQQQLAAAKFHLGILGGRIKNDLSVRTMVGQLDQILKDAIDKSRGLSHELSPAVLYHSSLSETFEWLAGQVQTKHGLTVYLDAEDHVQLQSEPLKIFLYKAAREILFNIVKHARVREARLRLKRMRGRLWLTIADRGQGFDPQTVERTGGFGLFCIRERIELLGGRMKVRSVKGQGSVFVIAMPDGDTPGRSAGPIGSAASAISHRAGELAGVPSAAGSRLRVVLADDHKVMREGLAALLSEQTDMDVVGQAGNGREAVNLTCDLRPDVVIMDVAMPLMAGDEATRQIKLHMPKTRVIALSMFEEAGVAETIRKAGAEAYLLKTAPFEELLTAIRGRLLS